MPQGLAKAAHLFVEGGDGAVIILRLARVLGIRRAVAFGGGDGLMRGVEPDDGEEGLAAASMRMRESSPSSSAAGTRPFCVE